MSKPVFQENSDEEEEEDMELFVYCVTCGHEIRQRNAFKHMERCFVKVCTLDVFR